MPRLKMRMLLLFAAVLAGSVPALAADPAKPEKQAAADIKLPPPPPGHGQVVFFRKGVMMGAAIGCTVHENGKKISSLRGGRYFVMVAKPGKHAFSVKSEATDVLTLEVEPDETQFASCRIKMGMMVGRPDIAPATEAEFRAVKSFKLVDADDMGEGALRPDQMVPAVAPAAN